MIWASDEKWDPTSVDHVLTRNNKWFEKCRNIPDDNNIRNFNEVGDYMYTESIGYNIPLDMIHQQIHVLDMTRSENILNKHHTKVLQLSKTDMKMKGCDLKLLKPYLRYVDDDNEKYNKSYYAILPHKIYRSATQTHILHTFFCM